MTRSMATASTFGKTGDNTKGTGSKPSSTVSEFIQRRQMIMSSMDSGRMAREFNGSNQNPRKK